MTDGTARQTAAAETPAGGVSPIVTLDCPAVRATLQPAQNAESGWLLRVVPVSAAKDPPALPGDRPTRAARWAIQIDAQLRTTVQARRPVVLHVPAAPPRGESRAVAGSIRAYRNLRLGAGQLVRPWVLPVDAPGPPTMEALYPFQRAGVDWLCSQPSGAILADDMGLGKTVQVIAAIRRLFNRAALRSVLLLCPKNLLANWEREFGRWAPELGVAVLSPGASLREEAWRAVFGRRHIVISNYEQMRSPPAALRGAPLDLMVADEAHRLRRSRARVTAGVRQLTHRRFWALSGTPLERDIEDLATLLSLIEPTRFAPSDAGLHPASLRAQARPYLLRRRKEDVLDSLPPVRETTDWLALCAPQERSYRAAIAEYRGTSGPVNELALLTRLRAICNLDPESRRSCKLDRIVELLERIRKQREKAVVFATVIAPLRELRHLLLARWGPSSARLLIGEMNMEERARAISEFQTDPDVIALLASSRVGGEGLTLVEANHVFLLDQWWNPSANDQARDRVVRIGQRNKVRVYRFCCRNTVEQNVEEVLEAKRDLFDDTVDRLTQDAAQVLKQVLAAVGIERLLPQH